MNSDLSGSPEVGLPLIAMCWDGRFESEAPIAPPA